MSDVTTGKSFEEYDMLTTSNKDDETFLGIEKISIRLQDQMDEKALAAEEGQDNHVRSPYSCGKKRHDSFNRCDFVQLCQFEILQDGYNFCIAIFRCCFASQWILGDTTRIDQIGHW